MHKIKSTKVQNTLGALYCISCVVLCQCACAEIGHVVAVNAWRSQFSLQHGLAASVGIVLGKAECC